jgi:hypothetical protein
VKGGYQGRITVDGKDRSVGVYASQRAAIEAQADAIAKLRRADFVREHVGSTTVKEYGARWLKDEPERSKARRSRTTSATSGSTSTRTGAAVNLGRFGLPR